MWMLFLSNPAFGNGQSTHCWISEQAVQALPSGELRTLLEDSAFETQWRNGTMFPDGGYAVGDDYGEIAHWEPFQLAYLEWIKTNYAPPWSDEAKTHIAFLMGLGSHGLADQAFDAMYFRRAYQYDANGNWDESLDTATDVAFIAETEPQTVPENWIPIDALLEIYNQQEYSVEGDTLNQGQSFLRLAVSWVGTASQNEEILSAQKSYYPWATSNLLNVRYPGSPPVEVGIIAAYWQVLWSQLNDLEITDSILYAYPPIETYDYPQDKDDIESHLSIVFAKGVDLDNLREEMIQVRDGDGVAHPVGVDLFYGADSHVVNIIPLENWKENQDYQLTITQELPFRDGTVVGREWSRSFSTKELPRVDENMSQEKKSGCQTTQAIDWYALLAIVFLGRRRRYD